MSHQVSMKIWDAGGINGWMWMVKVVDGDGVTQRAGLKPVTDPNGSDTGLTEVGLATYELAVAAAHAEAVRLQAGV